MELMFTDHTPLVRGPPSCHQARKQVKQVFQHEWGSQCTDSFKSQGGQKWKAVLSFDSTLDLLEVPNQEETSGTHMNCSEGPEIIDAQNKIHKVTNKSKIQRLMTPSATSFTEARLWPFGTVWNFSQVACDPSWVCQRRDALDGE